MADIVIGPVTQNDARYVTNEYLSAMPTQDPPREEDGTRSESYNLDNGVTINVTLAVAWDNRIDLIDDIIWNRLYFPEPSIDLNFRPRAMTAQVTGRACRDVLSGSTNQVLTYDEALIQFQYGGGQNTQGAGAGIGGAAETKTGFEYFTETLSTEQDFVRLNHENFVWDDTTICSGTPDTCTFDPTAGTLEVLKENEAPGKQNSIVNLTRQHFRLRDKDIINAMWTETGNVNPQNYTSGLLGITFSPETLLFVGPVLNRSFVTIPPAGEPENLGWDVTLKFLHRQETWNKYRRETEDGEVYNYIRQIPKSGNGYELYRSYPLGTHSNWTKFLY